MLKKPLIIVVGAGLLALACAAPAQAPAPADQPAPAQQRPPDIQPKDAPAKDAAPAMKDEPQTGGVINVRVTDNVFDWDLSYKGVSNGPYMALTYDSLLGYKYGPDIEYYDFQFIPELAESWKISPDAKTYTFQLRKGVKFQDIPPMNGREVTSADVKWTFEYMSRTGWAKDKDLPKGQLQWQFTGVEAIDTPDPYTAVVRFKDSFAPFLTYVALDLQAIQAHEIFDADGHLKKRPGGSGPFIWDQEASQKGAREVFKKNPDYYQSGKPYADEVRMIVMRDDSTAQAAFRTGQLDVLGTVTNPITAGDIRKNSPTAQEWSFENPVWHLYLNNNKPPFDDPRIRKAISLAIDRDEWIQIFGKGQGKWALAGAHPWVFTEDEIKKMLRYDPEEATKIIKELYPDGLDIEYPYATDRGDQLVKQFEVLQAQLKKVGINVIGKGMPYADRSRITKNGTYCCLYVTGKYPRVDIDADLFGVHHSSSKTNYSYINDEKLDALLVAQRQEPDFEKRKVLVQEAVRFINEMPFNLALFRPNGWHFVSARLKNYGPHHGNQGPGPLHNVWLDKKG